MTHGQSELKPSSLSFEVPLTPEGVKAECPRCSHVNVCQWGKDDRLEWAPKEGHCLHFTGVYESGRLGTVEAKFR